MDPDPMDDRHPGDDCWFRLWIFLINMSLLIIEMHHIDPTKALYLLLILSGIKMYVIWLFIIEDCIFVLVLIQQQWYPLAFY